ncbi:MAG: helix-turn-helix transcriptional regulator, partial [Anaerotignum sp.]|nr:helix-turn-helix transcriptional regulator [Anaerotignum sp.]
MDMKKTGELLTRLRKEKGMTQKQAAEVLQVSDRTVSKWERGKGL